MIEQVVIATTNKGKLKEFSSLLSQLNISVQSIAEFDNIPEVIEDGDTFEANARKKAETIRDVLNLPVIADDSGLMVDALNGRPGIYSARYAGEEHDDQKNNQKLLQELAGVSDKKRTAKFVSVIALAIPNQPTILARGECHGLITFEPIGKNGFGYDPLFYLPDFEQTMAQIEPEQKNNISHRANALKSLQKLIKNIEVDG